jgi:hypothetical protein
MTGCSADVSVDPDPGPDASLRVENRSSFAIEDLRVTPAGTSSWGGNLLGGDVLASGESITVDVVCDTYDAMLIDEDGVTCHLQNVDLCFSDASWIIRDDTCSVFGAAKAAREAAAKAAAANGSAGSANAVAP